MKAKNETTKITFTKIYDNEWESSTGKSLIVQTSNGMYRLYNWGGSVVNDFYTLTAAKRHGV